MTSPAPASWPSGIRPRAFYVLLLCAITCASRATAAAEEEVQEQQLTSLTIAPPHSQPVVGERIGFHGRWFALPVGYGWIEVKGLVDLEGRNAYHIKVEGRSNNVLSAFYPIHDVVDSYLDAQTLQPLRFEKHQREGRYRADEVVMFDHGSAHFHSLLNGSTKDISLPTQFQDLVSALYWFRAQPLQPNQALSVNIYTDEKIYDTEILVKQPLQLELLKRGTFPCLEVEPKARFKGLLVKRGRIWAYLTADAHRLPLLVKATTPWGPMSAVIDQDSLDTILK